jgi:hypothetical protein
LTCHCVFRPEGVWPDERTDEASKVHGRADYLGIEEACLEDGVFRWPQIEDGVLCMSSGQLSALLEGLEWRLVHEARETVAPTQAG